ncbi:MAG TPA: acyl carrier protein [Longimicrobiales bacterium]|nr:acyl carrier protein [Longimicrobiales bacterium]
MDVRQQIRSYIMENYLFTTDDSELGDSDSLMLRGIIDSTGALEVILFLEESYGITVDEEEMIPENLDSVDQIVAYVGRKRPAAS